MSYIAFDLDALNVVPDVAAASGLTPGDVAHGLLKLWAWCFREETETVTSTHLAGFFAGREAGPALAAFGFLEATEGAWRVRGAARYLRIKEAQRTAAERTNQRRQERQQDRTEERRSTDATPAVERTVQHRSFTDDRRPTTEHRTPTAAAAGVEKPVALVPDLPLPQLLLEERGHSGRDYFAFIQGERREAGYVSEDASSVHPQALATWFSQAMLELGGDVTALDEAYAGWAKDPYWVRQKLPFKGFMKQWAKFAPRLEVAR